MDTLNVAFKGDNAVPIVITHRTVTKAPEIERVQSSLDWSKALSHL